MPRKFFRKYLPSHESIVKHRFLGRFGAWLGHHNLWHLHRRSVAGGVAIGLFCGLIPGPLQMLGAAIVAIIFRVNLPVAVFTTLYSNPLTIVPLYFAAYEIGKFVTGENNRGLPQPELHLGGKPFAEWLPALTDWLAAMGKPFALGLLLLAAALAVIGYFSVRGAWRLHVIYSWRRRRSRRARQT